MIAIEAPFPQFFDKSGEPLDNGYLYIGVANQNPETNPITVYWDSAGTQPAAQPLRTMNGYIVRNGTAAAVFATGDYSLTVRDKRGRLLPSSANSSAPWSGAKRSRSRWNVWSAVISPARHLPIGSTVPKLLR